VTLTIRSRFTLVYAVVFGMLLLATSVVSYRVLAYQLDADITENLAERTSGLHGYLRFGADRPSVAFDATDPAEAAFVAEATRYYQVFDATTGELLLQSDALKPLGLEYTPAEVLQYRDRPVTFDVHTDYGRFRLSNSVLTPGDGRTYLLQVGISLAPTDGVLDRFLVLLLIGVPTGLAVAFFVGHWMSRVALTPLTHLADAAHSIDITDLRRRVPVRGTGDELDEVATAFNATLARLEHAVGEMRQFSTALAHELRTPLTALRGDIELALLRSTDDDLQRRFASQLEEIDKLKRLIEQILLLARAEAGEIPLKADAVDLTDVTSSLVEQLEPVVEEKGVTLACEHTDRVFVRGDADWLKRLILNLVDNAIKFTPTGGSVTVNVAHQGAIARLSVRDTGVGIDPADTPHIFERFYRADPARSSRDGVGLGLSLVQWIVDRHHGRIEVESRPGQGSKFTVELPLAEVPAARAINKS